MNKVGFLYPKGLARIEVWGQLLRLQLTEPAYFDSMRDLNHEKQGLCMHGGIWTRRVYQSTAILRERGQEGVEGSLQEVGIRHLTLSGMQTQ